MAFRLSPPDIQFMDAQGMPLAGGKMFFFASGTNTQTDTFQDAALTIPNTNPIVLNSAGYAGNIFLSPGQQYKVVLLDVNGVQQWTVDPVSDPTASGETVSDFFAITGTAGTSRTLFFQTGAQNRLGIGINPDAETGSNAGSNGFHSDLR